MWVEYRFFCGVPVQQNISIVIISLVQFHYTQVLFYKESMKYLKYIGKKNEKIHTTRYYIKNFWYYITQTMFGVL